MIDKLEMPIEQFAEAVAKENVRLNEHNEKLKGQTKLYFDAFNKAIARIKELEDALSIYVDYGTVTLEDLKHTRRVLEGKMTYYEAGFSKMVNDWQERRTTDRIEKLEAALRNIAEGDTPRTVKIAFRDDGQPSKNDRCKHGQWFYEDCGCCIEDYARKALEENND